MHRQKKGTNSKIFFLFIFLGILITLYQQSGNINSNTSDSVEVNIGTNYLENAESSINSTAYILYRLADCAYNQSYSSFCYLNVANDFTSRFTLSETLGVFRENEKLQEVFSHCHEVTHYLSRNEYKRTKSIPESYASCTAVCHGGCYHGVIESYFDQKGIPLYGADDSIIITEIRSVCKKPEDYAVPQLYNECIHGIGHAMMFITNGDLPYSLKLCDGLQTLTDRENCYSGVFMESSSSSTNRDHPGKFIKPDDPLYPCNILDSRYLRTCYTYQSSYFSIITNYDWKKTIGLCNTVPVDYRMGCFRFVGSNQVGYTQDVNLMKKDCDLIAEPQFKDVCILGVVDSLNGRYNGDESKIIAFCSIVDEEDKQSCYTEMAHDIRVWVRDEEELRNKCLKIPEEKYRTLCLGIALSANNASGTAISVFK